MSARTFLDTNVLLYTDDADNVVKQSIALTVVEQAQASGTGVISLQVLTEYMSASTKKLHVPVDIAAAKVKLFAQFEVVQLAPHDVLSAAALHVEHSLAWWDALIVQAALKADCSLLITEDLQDGRQFGKLTVRNPFR